MKASSWLKRLATLAMGFWRQLLGLSTLLENVFAWCIPLKNPCTTYTVDSKELFRKAPIVYAVRLRLFGLRVLYSMRVEEL